MPGNPSVLGYALLGLIQQQPRSGYDLRKMFAATPMMSFSDSPGAIYPALARLERSGLIRGKVEDRSGLRRRKVFRVTAKGMAALEDWLAKPVTRDDVIWNMDELMLRFAFMGPVSGATSTLSFLENLEAELSTHLLTLRDFLDSARQAMPLSGLLALEGGIELFKAHHRWAKRAIEAFKRES